MVWTLEKKVGRCWHTRNLTKHSELSEKKSDTTVKQERLQCLGVPIVEHQLQHSPSSVQFSRSVMSDSLWPHEPQHTRPPCPLPTPGVYPNSCPLAWWCHPTISVIPFSSSLQSFPASGSFSNESVFCIRWPKYSASASVLPMNIQDWFPLGWTAWISLQSKGLKTLLQYHSSKASILLYSPTLTSIHDYWKNHSLE